LAEGAEGQRSGERPTVNVKKIESRPGQKLAIHLEVVIHELLDAGFEDEAEVIGNVYGRITGRKIDYGALD